VNENFLVISNLKWCQEAIMGGKMLRSQTDVPKMIPLGPFGETACLVLKIIFFLAAAQGCAC
jgi:hypothetical protein